jgi:retron-type reverse transcriptase
MSADLLIPTDKLDHVINSAPYRYKIYQIPKRSGAGMRTIAQPAKEVKRIQYWVMKNIFSELEIHANATAYTRGKSIFSNASPHSAHSYLIKVDFKDFFFSIKGADFIRYSKKYQNYGFSDEDINRLVKVLFWSQKRGAELNLSIGAPSSPLLSNLIMFEFDNIISDFCTSKGISYTRYSDDITVSMNDKALRGYVFERINSEIRNLDSPKLQLNHNKTVFASKAHKRFVTGLVITNNAGISLGRDKKRKIRAQICHYMQGKLSEKERLSLKGMLAFARDVEPEFVSRMEDKYGKMTIM